MCAVWQQLQKNETKFSIFNDSMFFHCAGALNELLINVPCLQWDLLSYLQYFHQCFLLLVHLTVPAQTAALGGNSITSLGPVLVINPSLGFLQCEEVS